MNTKIQFGSQDPITIPKKTRATSKNVKKSRADVADVGLESNHHTRYDHEVKFENIRTNVNVCRVKTDSPDDNVGVAKGAILTEVPVCVPTNDAAATEQAMKKRCDFKPSLTTMDSFNHGHDILMSKFDPMETIRVDKELVEKYLKKCGGSKAARLVEAMEGHEWKYSGEEKHVFAKQEVLLKAHQSQPRVVYQGNDMYNALTGPVVMELNDRMKTIFSLKNPKNTGNRVIYACGVSGEDLGNIMEQSEGEPIESDMKNNDGSQSAEFRRPEAMFYYKLGAPKWFVKEFASNLSVRVWTRYGISAQVEGQRWSGETTTTTGNSYVSMALMQAALEKACVTESTNIHGGDDYLGYVKGDVEKVKAGIEAVTSVSGMKAEVVPQLGRHHATFYRKRYVRSTAGCRPVPQFGRVLAKLNLRANKNSEVNDRDYMAGKYYSAAFEHKHVPGIRDLLVKTAEELSDKPFFDLRLGKLQEMGGAEGVRAQIASTQPHPVTEFSEFLNEVYGIGYDDLVDVYARLAQSCVDYCDGWVRPGKNGKLVNVKGNSRYTAPSVSGDVVDALVRMDI